MYRGRVVEARKVSLVRRVTLPGVSVPTIAMQSPVAGQDQYECVPIYLTWDDGTRMSFGDGSLVAAGANRVKQTN